MVRSPHPFCFYFSRSAFPSVPLTHLPLEHDSHAHDSHAPAGPAAPGITGRILSDSEHAVGLEKLELDEIRKGRPVIIFIRYDPCHILHFLF